MLESLVFSLAALFSVLNPLNITAYFLSLSEGLTDERKKNLAVRASILAALIASFAALVGGPFLEFMGVRISSFRIAGGIILLIFGIQTCTGRPSAGKNGSGNATVLLASPLMAGPGTISMSILLASQVGIYTTLAAIAIVVLLALTFMLSATRIKRVVGEDGMRVILRVLGLVVVAVAIQFIIVGFGTP
ncbi:MAG: MarC family protein [Candidatus Burarchaeum sp.]|nr:MarC family protein [Candidatus Burarchaeum sp.]MDO8340270.1 MarC family protein [Candidatus Burarchaeum sp.]